MRKWPPERFSLHALNLCSSRISKLPIIASRVWAATPKWLCSVKLSWFRACYSNNIRSPRSQSRLPPRKTTMNVRGELNASGGVTPCLFGRWYNHFNSLMLHPAQIKLNYRATTIALQLSRSTQPVILLNFFLFNTTWTKVRSLAYTF